MSTVTVDRQVVKERAYLLWETAAKTPGADLHDRDYYWSQAELAEQAIVRQKVQDKAYYLWLAECRRVGGVVHSNDWHHWFEAEQQITMRQTSRYKKMNEQPDPSASKNTGNRPQDSAGANTACHSPADALNGVNRGSDTDDLPKSPPDTGDGSMKPRKADDAPSDPEREPDGSAREQEGVYHTVDLELPEFDDKLVVTDESQNVVFHVADSLEQIGQFVKSKSFQDRLKTEFGEDAEYVVHSCGRNRSKISR